MALGCAFLGLLVGTVLHRTADRLVAFATGSTTPRLTAATLPVPVLWHWLAAFFRRGTQLSASKSTWSNLAIELLSATLFIYFWERLGLSWKLGVSAVAGSFFLLVALIDFRYHLVLNVMIYPAAVLVLLLQLTLPDGNVLRALAGGIFALVMFLISAWLRPGELGMGDVKLAGLIGLIFGFPLTLWALAVGILAGGLTAVALVLIPKWGLKSQIPYAPFLCLGALVALLYNPLPPPLQ